jgi:hypothetical protein
MAGGRRVTMKRVVVATLVFAWCVWNVAVMVSPAFATNCDGDCAQHMSCTGAQSNCPMCDLGLWDSCSDWQQVRYPNTVFENIGGDRVATLQGSVVCMEITDCANGTYRPFQICVAGWCSLTPAIIQYCLTCTATGTVHTSYANHYVCTDCTEE